MNKRTLHHELRPIRRVKTINYVIFTLLLAVCTVFALRQNNLNMITLRDRVIVADQANRDVETALNNLRSYIYGHMNTSLATSTSVYPPIQLKGQYDRLVAAEKERVSKANEKIYRSAQNFCEKQNPRDFSGRNRVPCIEKFVSARGEKEQPIPEDLYKFDFVSPNWSSDLAGWLLVATGLMGLLTLIRLGLEMWVRAQDI